MCLEARVVSKRLFSLSRSLATFGAFEAKRNIDIVDYSIDRMCYTVAPGVAGLGAGISTRIALQGLEQHARSIIPVVYSPTIRWLTLDG